MSNKRCDCIQPNYNAFTDRCMICGGYYCSDVVTKNNQQPMTQTNEPTIAAMNEVIAQFRGYKKREKLYPTDRQILEGEGLPNWYEDSLKYHTSWDWLMPVVEKIRKLGYHIEITISVDCSVEIIKLRGDPVNDSLHIISFSSPINAVYTSVYQFIQWFNQQKQNNGEQIFS